MSALSYASAPVSAAALVARAACRLSLRNSERSVFQSRLLSSRLRVRSPPPPPPFAARRSHARDTSRDQGLPSSFLKIDRFDRMKDAVVLAVAIVGVVYLLSMETIGANARMALAEPFNGNSAAVLTMVISVIGSVTGWNRGKAVPAARKVNGLPSVDPKRLKQHDVFNLVVLPILMVLNLGVWLSLVDAYVYTILFSCYMASDAVYIWTYPEAVPQPSLVLAHHSFVLALLSHPLRIPANAIFTAVRTLLNFRAFSTAVLHMGLVLATAATWRVIRGTCGACFRMSRWWRSTQ